ncbi:MAG: acetolactate synthase small subunit, partial [Actinobacteria bacterium]|nr:acetolactate synthase small subunit [Actinomycetota bacterium]
SRRGYNIESLAVGPTETSGVSRMTIVTEVDDDSLEQITKQLNKLINVLKIVELDGLAAVERELMLIKVKAEDSNRTAVLQLVELFRAKVVDVSGDAVTIEATGSREKLEALCDGLQPYGVKEIVQSGVVALARGSRSIGDRALRSTDRLT